MRLLPLRYCIGPSVLSWAEKRAFLFARLGPAALASRKIIPRPMLIDSKGLELGSKSEVQVQARTSVASFPLSKLGISASTYFIYCLKENLWKKIFFSVEALCSIILPATSLRLF
jgi:hypothetical protein